MKRHRDVKNLGAFNVDIALNSKLTGRSQLLPVFLFHRKFHPIEQLKTDNFYQIQCNYKNSSNKLLLIYLLCKK